MKPCSLAIIAGLLLSSLPATAQSSVAAQPSPAATGAVSSMTCEQIAAEMTALTGTTFEVATNAAERANRKRNMPTSVANTVTNGALGMAVGSVPGGAAALGIALSVKQQAEDRIENREAAKDQRAFEQMGSPENLQNLERLAMLNELAQSKCPEFTN